MVKKIVIALGIIALIILAIVYIPITRKIDVSVEGIQCRIGEETEEKSVRIKVKGSYKNYVFKDDTFKGTLEVEGYEQDSDNYDVELRFSNNSSPICYVSITEDGKPDINTLGNIIMKDNFKQILLCISEPSSTEGDEGKSWTGNDGLIIAAPVQTRAEAMELANKITKDTFYEMSNWK